jgi:hypothetical protein
MNGKVYFLCSSDGIPRYVGITMMSLDKRLRDHLYDYRHNPHKVNWVKKNKKDIKIVLIKDNIESMSKLKSYEIFYISEFKKMYDLLNATDGGDLCPFSRKGTSPHNKGIRKVDNDLIRQIQSDYIPYKFGIIKLSKKYNLPETTIERYLKLNI